MSWLLKIASINFAAPPTGNQTVQISYRQGGTSGAFSTPVSVTFNPDGTINSTPNPYIISAIDDSWNSIDVKSVNTCNSMEVLKTFFKP